MPIFDAKNLPQHDEDLNRLATILHPTPAAREQARERGRARLERATMLAEPSQLASRELAPKLYSMAGDTIGGTVKLLKAASAHAINIGVERITAPVLDDLGWTRLGDWDAVARVV